MKVFIDTNFLVSALATRGLSADIFQVILTEHEIMTGEFVLSELHRVLITKLKVPAKIAYEAEQLPRKHYVEPTPDHPSEIQIGDEDDKWVLESALRAGAEIIITGDKDLLDISDQVSEINIVSPREFWELIQK